MRDRAHLLAADQRTFTRMTFRDAGDSVAFAPPASARTLVSADGRTRSGCALVFTALRSASRSSSAWSISSMVKPPALTQ